MDPIIVGALITAAAQIVAARISAARQRRRAERPESSSPPTSPDFELTAYRPPPVRRPRNRVRPILRIYVLGVAMGTLALLVFLYRDLPPFVLTDGLGGLVRFWATPIEAWDPSPVRLLVFWFALTVGFGMLTETLPKGGATTTVASVPDLAALLMFGPATATLLVGVTDLIANAGKSPLRITFNFFQIMATVAVTGVVYSACGGGFGDEMGLTGRPMLALVFAPFVYFLTNTFLVTIAIHLRERISMLQAWRRNFEWQVPHVLFLLLPFGALLALCQVYFGIPGALLCSLTVVFAHFSFRGWIQNRAARFETVRVIVSEIDRTDPSTVDHSKRIAAYSVKVAWELGVSTHEADDIEFAALFHNLGTVAMKHVFLMENRKLTESEQRAMRRHPEIGYHLLRKVPLLHRAAEIIFCHQERPDGEGYPRGLVTGEIPLGSEIILAVDAFDAMLHGRAHKRAKPIAEAYKELAANAGTQFSWRVVEALIRLHRTNRLDDELDETFRQEQAHNRYGLRMLKYRSGRKIRLAWSFFRQGLVALFGRGNPERPNGEPRGQDPPDRPGPDAERTKLDRIRGPRAGERSTPEAASSEDDATP